MAIQFAAVLAVIDAVGKVAGAINSVIQLVRNVESFFGQPGPDTHDLYVQQAIELSETRVRTAIQDAVRQMARAISQVDDRIIQLAIDEQLGIKDTAIQDLEQWRRTHSDTSLALALSGSARAVATTSLYLSNRAVPMEAGIFPFVEILACRLAILSESDRAFARSSVLRAPLQNGIALIRMAASSLRASVAAANHVNVRQTTRRRRGRDGTWETTVFVTVSYANVSGTVNFYRDLGSFEPGEQVDAVEAARQEAAPFLQRGIDDDLRATKVPLLDEAADRFDAMLVESQMRLVERLLGTDLAGPGRARLAHLWSKPEVRQYALLLPQLAEALDTSAISPARPADDARGVADGAADPAAALSIAVARAARLIASPMPDEGAAPVDGTG